MTTHRSVASMVLNGNSTPSKLPLRRTNSKPSGLVSPTGIKPPTNFHVLTKNNEDANKWRKKYEETEDKRRKLLSEREQARRSVQDLERKYSHLQIKNEEMETELFEKNENLTRLTTASKTLFKEYDALKNQYELETGAMNRALADASNWYKENKLLRRRTLLLDNDSVDEGVDACEPTSTDSDLDNLRDSVKKLSEEVAHLQAELNAAKLLEFETTESNAQLAQELEEEKLLNNRLQNELNSLNTSHEQLIRISQMMKRELEELKDMAENQKNNADMFRKEADDYKKERNVLAHQSTILLQGLQTEEGIDSLLLMQEIEELKSIIEDERNKHAVEIQTLQEQMEELHKNPHMEVLEERLQLAEAELYNALERADKAEEKLTAPPPAPPLPPPPPPAPPLPLQSDPPTVPLRIKKMNRIATPSDNNNDITGTDSKKSPPMSGVNDEIINQIKNGFFTLRKREKNESSNTNKKERESSSKAVAEFLNVLGGLKRTSKKLTLKPSANYDEV